MSAVIDEAVDETFESDKAEFDAEFERPADDEPDEYHRSESHEPACIQPDTAC